LSFVDIVAADNGNDHMGGEKMNDSVGFRSILFLLQFLCDGLFIFFFMVKT